MEEADQELDNLLHWPNLPAIAGDLRARIVQVRRPVGAQTARARHRQPGAAANGSPGGSPHQPRRNVAARSQAPASGPSG